MNFIIRLITVFILASSCTAQDYRFETFSVQQLKSDLIFFRNRLDSAHIDLYHAHPKEEFDSLFSKLESSITEPMNRFEFYWHILPVYDMLKDAHSQIIFPFEYSKEYDKQGGLFIPIATHIENGSVYIKKNYSERNIPIYSEIVEINKVPITDILNALEKVSNTEYPEAEYNYMGHIFKRVLFPLFGFDKHYNLTVKTPKGELISYRLEGIPLDDFPLNNQPNFELYYTKDSIAILDINRCEDKEIFSEFCLNVFDELRDKKIENLIIDIRNNGGGSTQHGYELFPYLTDTTFSQYPKASILHSPLTDGSDSSYVETLEPDNGVAHDLDLKFDGDVYMIANRGSFSSASVMAATFKCYNIGTLVGQETGGTEVFYDEPLLYSLPESGIRFLASYKVYWSPCGERMDRGIQPDFEVDWMIEDQINEVDSEIEFVRTLIKEKGL